MAHIVRATLLCCALHLCTSSPQAQSDSAVDGEAFRRLHTTVIQHNAESCNACHIIPVMGGSSRVSVEHIGSRASGKFVEDPKSGFLSIRTNGRTVEKTIAAEGRRITLNLLGDGYVEAIPDEVFEKIAIDQVKETDGIIHGQVSRVSVVERPNRPAAVGRFGWKSQHSSLLSASAHALNNELRVPNYLFLSPVDGATFPTSDGGSAPETKEELASIVRFLRSTEPIAADVERSDAEAAKAGSRTFEGIGCSICHVRTLKTAAESSSLIGGTVLVTKRLANKEIHPFSDYLLHDVGTGDGIVQNIQPRDYDETTSNKFRTAPLWGLRYRTWLMHDGKSVTYHQAIIRHSGEAVQAVQRYLHLSPIDRENLRLFLDSL